MADTKTTTQSDDRGGDTSASALRADIDRLREDIATLTRDLGTAGSERAREARNRARETRDRAWDAADERYQRGRGFVETEMRDRPLTVLGVSFAAGLLVGRLLGR